jgi:hypothetical protein
MNLYSNAKNVCRDDARSESVHRDLPHRLMSVQEAANFLGLSVSTLNKMRLSGNGPPYNGLANPNEGSCPRNQLHERRCPKTPEIRIIVSARPLDMCGDQGVMAEQVIRLR